MELTLTSRQSRRIPSIKFALWLSMASITMLFAGLLSAYIVRQAAGNWFEFTLPWHFSVSTAIIIASSVLVHLSLRAFRQHKEATYKVLLIASALLGIAFIALQYEGWLAMQAAGVDLKGNPSGAFVYMLSGVHLAHVLAGVAAFGVALVHAFALPFIVTRQRIVRLETTAQYWHYVDVLWIVLFLFLTFYR